MFAQVAVDTRRSSCGSLPGGWGVRIFERVHTSISVQHKAGACDTYFIAPGGQRFRSRAEVLRMLRARQKAGAASTTSGSGGSNNGDVGSGGGSIAGIGSGSRSGGGVERMTVDLTADGGGGGGSSDAVDLIVGESTGKVSSGETNGTSPAKRRRPAVERARRTPHPDVGFPGLFAGCLSMGDLKSRVWRLCMFCCPGSMRRAMHRPTAANLRAAGRVR